MATHPFHTLTWTGTGPFMLDGEFVSDQGFPLVRNPDYFLGAPLIDKITFEYIDSSDEAFAAMQRGEIDASTYPVLTTDQYQTLVDDPRFNVLSVQGSVLRASCSTAGSLISGTRG